MFIFMNAVVYVVQIVFISLFFHNPEYKISGLLIFQYNILLDITVCLLLGIGFLIYGIFLFRSTLSDTSDSAFDRYWRRRELVQVCAFEFAFSARVCAFEFERELRVQIVISTVVFTACFLLRVGVFLYRPITGEYLNTTVFAILAYIAPEMFASLLELALIQSRSALPLCACV